MLNTAFAPWPSYSQEEADAVSAVLLSNRVNYWTGQQCRHFEREFAAAMDSAYAIALANGTVALDLALKALEIGAGDEVIVTSRTFLASVSSIVNAGATPIFCDVELDSQLIAAPSIAALISPRTKAIICVHLAGWMCDMDPIMQLANAHRIAVIEDCAQAHGARYKGRAAGSIGHVAAWSFCQDKIMSTGGEGGMVTTNDQALWQKMWAYKDHGKSYDSVYHKQHPAGFRWLHDSFGTNWRMTEMQAAIGRIQLTRLAEWVALRNQHSQQIFAAFADSPYFQIATPNSDYLHAYYKCYVQVASELPEGWSRDRIMQYINDLGVPCYSGSCSEVYLERAFDGTPWRPASRLPHAKQLGESSLMFLVHPSLSAADMQQTCAAIRQLCQQLADAACHA